MLGVWVKLRVQPGKAEEFEELLAKQARAVRAQEEGNKLYELMRSREEQNTYFVSEIYIDEEALKTHINAPHMVENRPQMQTLLDGKPEAQMFDSLFCDL